MSPIPVLINLRTFSIICSCFLLYSPIFLSFSRNKPVSPLFSSTYSSLNCTCSYVNLSNLLLYCWFSESRDCC